jgi:Asp/Glu/hydantoin racemase
MIEEALGLPVIDPVQAAVARAASLIALRYPRAG